MRGSVRRWLVIACALGLPLSASTIVVARAARWSVAPIWHRTLSLADGARLRPGQYIWQADPHAAEPVGIVVDLGHQRAYVYQGGDLVAITTVSSGRRHYETPAGVFPILEKAVYHRSTIYSGAPMPYMQRLTWGGVALHAGGVPGYRQSHGCIHLPRSFAVALFRITRIGSIVQVVHALPQAQPVQMVALYEDFPTTAEAVAQMTAL